MVALGRDAMYDPCLDHAAYALGLDDGLEQWFAEVGGRLDKRIDPCATRFGRDFWKGSRDDA